MRWRGVDTGSRHSHGDEQSCLSWARLECLVQQHTHLEQGLGYVCLLEKPRIKTCVLFSACLHSKCPQPHWSCWILIILWNQCWRKSTINLTTYSRNSIQMLLPLLCSYSETVLCSHSDWPPSALLSALLDCPNAPLPHQQNCRRPPSTVIAQSVCASRYNLFLHELFLAFMEVAHRLLHTFDNQPHS